MVKKVVWSVWSVWSVWIVVGMLASWAAPASANCSCQCIEGVARTLCTRVDEAQAKPSECGAGVHKIVCAAAPASAETPQHYTPPAGGADCRGQRLWDPRTGSYSAIAKVCDLDRNAVTGD